MKQRFDEDGKEYYNVLEVSTWCDTDSWKVIPTINIMKREVSLDWLCFSLDFYFTKRYM